LPFRSRHLQGNFIVIQSAFNASYAGIAQNLQGLNAAAQTIANPSTSTDVNAVMQLKAAEHGVKVNAAVAAAVYETSDYLLDILV